MKLQLKNSIEWHREVDMKTLIEKIKRRIPVKVKKNPNPVRWGVIGTGNMAEVFGKAIDKNPDGIIEAVASRTKSKADKYSKRHFNCKAYGSYEEIVNDSHVEIIYIATPIKQHYENIKMCLENKKNVICEKPLTETHEQMLELKMLAKKNDCFFMEGMWMKCLPTYQKALKWIEEGKIGELELIKVDFYKHELINTEYSIFDKNSAGGVLNDYGIYALSFPLGFIKGNIEIQGDSRESKYGIDSDWQINMKTSKEKAFINISSDFMGSSRAALIGKEGSIVWESQFNRTNKLVMYNAEGIQIETFVAKYSSEGFEYEVSEVQRCLRKGLNESSFVTLASTENTLKIKDNLYRLGGEKFNIEN